MAREYIIVDGPPRAKLFRPLELFFDDMILVAFTVFPKGTRKHRQGRESFKVNVGIHSITAVIGREDNMWKVVGHPDGEELQGVVQMYYSTDTQTGKMSVGPEE